MSIERFECYTFGIKKKGLSDSTENFLPLGHFHGNVDYWNLFQKLIGTVNGRMEKHEKYFKTITLSSETLKVDSGRRIIRGIIDGGSYGEKSTYYDSDSGSHRYDVREQDTKHRPFYFFVYIPTQKSKGLIILQRRGTNTIRDVFQSVLKRYLSEIYGNFIIVYNPAIDAEAAKKVVLDGQYDKVTLTKHGLPPDRFAQQELTRYEIENMTVKVEITAPRGTVFERLQNRARQFMEDPNASFFEIPELQSLGFNRDERHQVSIRSKLDGQTRTIDLGDTGKIRPYYVIDNLKWEDGQPTFESLDNAALRLFHEFKL